MNLINLLFICIITLFGFNININNTNLIKSNENIITEKRAFGGITNTNGFIGYSVSYDLNGTNALPDYIEFPELKSYIPSDFDKLNISVTFTTFNSSGFDTSKYFMAFNFSGLYYVQKFEFINTVEEIFGSDSLYYLTMNATFECQFEDFDFTQFFFEDYLSGTILNVGSYSEYSIFVNYYFTFNFTLNNTGDGNYTQGYNDGYNQGLNEGLKNNTAGYDNGYNVGYDAGFLEGQKSDNVLFGLVSAIGDLPLNILNNILNFNFLGVNIAGFVFSIITIFIILFIVKKVIQ